MLIVKASSVVAVENTHRQLLQKYFPQHEASSKKWAVFSRRTGSVRYLRVEPDHKLLRCSSAWWRRSPNLRQSLGARQTLANRSMWSRPYLSLGVSVAEGPVPWYGQQSGDCRHRRRCRCRRWPAACRHWPPINPVCGPLVREIISQVSPGNVHEHLVFLPPQ